MTAPDPNIPEKSFKSSVKLRNLECKPIHKHTEHHRAAVPAQISAVRSAVQKPTVPRDDDVGVQDTSEITFDRHGIERKIPPRLAEIFPPAAGARGYFISGECTNSARIDGHVLDFFRKREKKKKRKPPNPHRHVSF